ncbi:unnamed protein product [Gongylonema pulchrum]|uniref:Glucosamine 6-phosphate N-acetyltransferase n=1 Tax=Gongylonema pulchrum TaxID=637853 RepID=A0A183DZ63_9BILA|nr:unnamed protein product [Gongylonema pulchrum]
MHHPASSEAVHEGIGNSSARPVVYEGLENEKTKRVVASASLIVEWKFIHRAGCRGRIEDVVVDEALRGKHLAKCLIETLVGIARIIHVYKLSLECKDELISYYEQFEFSKDKGNNFLVRRFEIPETDTSP